MKKMDRAKEYFNLGKQYVDSAIYLMNVICRNGNKTYGVAKTPELAEKIMVRKSALSDTTLFVPAIFDCYHGVELYIKGLIILINKDFSTTHNIDGLIKLIEKNYSDTEIINQLNEFYFNKITIIQKYKNDNSIITDKELYMSLRYPEDRKAQKTYDKSALEHNGNLGVDEMKEIIKILQNITELILKIYHEQKPVIPS